MFRCGLALWLIKKASFPVHVFHTFHTSSSDFRGKQTMKRVNSGRECFLFAINNQVFSFLLFVRIKFLSTPRDNIHRQRGQVFVYKHWHVSMYFGAKSSSRWNPTVLGQNRNPHATHAFPDAHPTSQSSQNYFQSRCYREFILNLLFFS